MIMEAAKIYESYNQQMCGPSESALFTNHLKHKYIMDSYIHEWLQQLHW